MTVVHVVAPEPLSDVLPGGRASPARRLGATAMDVALLTASLVWVLAFEFALWDDEAVGWVTISWALVVAPLYFGLYHAYGTGATPGQQDVGLAVRDARTHALVGPVRGIAGALVGLVEILTVLPAVLDLLLIASGSRSLRERLLRLETVPFALRGTQRRLPPTAPPVAELFTAAGELSRSRRAQALVGRHTARIVGSVLGTYAVMIGLAVVFGGLVLLDGGGEWGGYGIWFTYAALLFMSGVYWTQAVVVVVVEEVRTGDAAGFAETLRRATRRLNGLAATLLVLGSALFVLLLLAYVGVGVLGLLVLPFVLGRFALAVPAIVLEDMRVTEAAAASWRRTRRRTWRLGWAVVLSSVVVQGVAGVATGTAFGVLTPLLESASSGAAFVAVGSLAFVVAAVPIALVLAWVGAWWTLVYHDLRVPDGPEEA
jgi:hypothetical protein